MKSCHSFSTIYPRQVMEAAISISMQHPNLVRTFTYSLKPLGEDSTNRELL